MNSHEQHNAAILTNHFLDDPLKCIKRWPSKSSKKWVYNFVYTLSNNSEIYAIVGFGSAIRTVEYSADIDLLYIYGNKKLELGSIPIDVDVRGYSNKEIEKLLDSGHEMLCWAVRFGCHLYEKNRFWTNLRKVRINQLQLPSATEAIKRAEMAKGFFKDIISIGDEDAADEQLITMLTHKARAHLIRNGIFPASRPELPEQLISIGETEISTKLIASLNKRKRLIFNYVKSSS